MLGADHTCMRAVLPSWRRHVNVCQGEGESDGSVPAEWRAYKWDLPLRKTKSRRNFLLL